MNHLYEDTTSAEPAEAYKVCEPARHRLLVVDDEESVAITISEILRRDGYRVDTSLSGADALANLRKHEYDLVLADLHMEGIDGISVLQEVRRRAPLTITIMITGFASLESAISAMRHGAYDYLIKPCVIEDLKLTIQRGLEHRRLILAERTARARLERLNNELESRVLESTADLLRTNDELLQANRAKDVFFAILSHELRTPLTPILGWSRLLRSGSQDADSFRRGLEVIERNADLLNKLIGDLLDVSRVVSGKLQFNLEPTDLGAVARQVVDGGRDRFAAKSIELRFDAPAEPVVVNGSPVRLHQVIWNLLSNALKFTSSKGQVTLGISADGNEAQIAVSDTGIGIDPKFLPHVFELFVQADNSRHSAYQGLGIGLALVRRIAELHGGWVRAESNGRGRGATFVIGIPRLMSGAPVEAPQPKAVDLPIPARVLLVEDSTDAADLLSLIFTGAGAEVSLAKTGEEALALLESVNPRLIVSDIGLAGMDGMDLIRAIRCRPGFDAVPAIAVSGYATTQDRERALEAGFTEHIPKPIEPETLLTIARRLLV